MIYAVKNSINKIIKFINSLPIYTCVIRVNKHDYLRQKFKTKLASHLHVRNILPLFPRTHNSVEVVKIFRIVPNALHRLNLLFR